MHRVPGGQGRSVFAFTDELDAWSASRSSEDAPASSSRRRPVPLAILATVMLLGAGALVAALARGWPGTEIARVEVTHDAIRALTESGKAVWSSPLPAESTSPLRRFSQIVDLDGDGHPDVLSGLNLNASAGLASVGTLIALGHDGRALWRQSLDTHLVFGGGTFDAPWQSDDVNVIRRSGGPLVTWAVHHYTWWPSLLAVFRADGRRLGTFVNSGWIRMAEPTPDGRLLVVGGFSNSRNGAAFAVLDPQHVDGASPEDAGSTFECRNCPAGRPLRYLTIEWTDVAAVLPQDERDVTVIVSPTGNVELGAQQRQNVDAILDLSPTLAISRATFSDNFWEMHRRLEAAGTLTHSRDRCPFRNGPIVREWTPAGGWRTIRP